MHRVAPEPVFRFEAFEFDARAHKLRKHGVKIRLAHKPFQALRLLLENAGTVVRREQLCDQLWGEDTYGDFEDSLNHVIKRLRDVLLDSADSPKFIETIPGVGYRFVAPVSLVQTASEQSTAPPTSLRPVPRWLILGVVVGLAIVFTGITYRTGRPNAPVAPPYKLTQLTRDTGLTFQPTVSSDGTLMAYTSDRSSGSNLDIWLARVGSRDEPRRLTNHESNDYQPSFSPDGTTIAFRSERGEGGVYLVPTLGGPERFVARDGRDPKFSPDGRRIAYWVDGGGQFYPRKLYIIDAAGGTPRQLAKDFDYVRHPIWSPDGRHLLFVGVRRYGNQDYRGDHPDLRWWVVPVAGGPPRETGILAALEKHRLEWRFFVGGRRMSDSRWNTEGPQLWLPETNDIVFSAQSGDSVNLWRIPVSSKGEVAGVPVRLTAGAGLEITPRQDAKGRLIFADFAINADIWSLPIDPNTGKLLGSPQRLTHDTSTNHTPWISADGGKLVFLSDRAGNEDLWIRDRKSGKESPLTTTEHSESRGVISGDGSIVAYGYEGSIFVLPSEGGPPTEVVSDCGANCKVFDLSKDGNELLYYWGKPQRYIWRDLSTGKATEVLERTKSSERVPHNARFSPNGRWLTFHTPLSPTRYSVFVAPLGDGHRAGEDSWIEVSDETILNLLSLWSPNGRLLYYVSRDGGLTRLFARPLHPETKEPAGPDREVYRFPQSPYALPFNTGQVGLLLGGDQLVFTLQEMSGNIWMAEPQS